MMLRYVVDSLRNLVSGLGTSRDKTTSTQYVVNELTKLDLDNAYRGDWIARKVVAIPALDQTREWRGWQADKNQITALEAVERAHRVQHKTQRALVRARLYGGAVMIIGTRDSAERADQELRIESIARDSLKFLHVVSRHEITAGDIETDVLSPYYGEPKWYETHPTDGRPVKIHPSRVVRFGGAELPDATLATQGWGDSVLIALDDAIKNAGITSGGIATLVHESKIDVIKIPNLMANMGDATYRSTLTERLQSANLMKSMVNALVMDKEEEWERIAVNFAGLPEVLKLYLLIASGAADIPATRLLGQSAVGLGATGEGDLRNYYDRIRSEQNIVLSADLTRLDEIIIRSALGSRPPELHYLWRPLYQLDEAQRAEVDLKRAQAFDIDVKSGVMSPETLRTARQNQLIEAGTYPGLEQAIADEPEESDEPAEETPEEIEEFEQRRVAANDARPRTLYVRRDVLNAGDIIEWARDQGFKSTVPASEMHVTIIYSKSLVDWMKIAEDYAGGSGSMEIGEGGVRLVEKLGDNATALLFTSSHLAWRHVQMKEAGAQTSYPDYQPHVTITYDEGDVDLDKVVPYRGVIKLGPEIFEEVDAERAAQRFSEVAA